MSAKNNFLWTPDLAYAVGLITTDGNLSKDKRHILFTTTERRLAENLKKCLCLDCKIMVTKPSGFGKKLAYRINFGNVNLYNWFLNIWLMPNKTGRLSRLRIPDAFFADFLRGFIDGDGSIFTYKDRYRTYKEKRYVFKRLYTCFNSTSLEHIKWLRSRIYKLLNMLGSLNSYVSGKYKRPLWKLRFAKKDSLKLLSWIYYKPNLPCLLRKKRVFDTFEE